MRIVCLNHELACWDIDALRDDGYDEIIYHYIDDGYDGEGQLIALHTASERIYVYNLGHCSCYGPVDDGPCACYTYNEMNDILFNPDVLAGRDLIEPLGDFLRNSVKASEERYLGN